MNELSNTINHLKNDDETLTNKIQSTGRDTRAKMIDDMSQKLRNKTDVSSQSANNLFADIATNKESEKFISGLNAALTAKNIEIPHLTTKIDNIMDGLN